MLTVTKIAPGQASKICAVEEGQFSDVKAIEIKPADLTKTMAAFANTEGGDLYVGIDDNRSGQPRKWRGFPTVEAANGHLQCFEILFPLGIDIHGDFLRCDIYPGVVLHIQINKTPDIKYASNKLPYIRRGAQNIPVNSDELRKRLEYAKGVASFETEAVPIPQGIITDSDVVKSFIHRVVPDTTPAKWLQKQVLVREGKPTVAGVLLFADEPQAALPKRCGIKVYRYKTNAVEGFREALAFDPRTVEGCLQQQIKSAVAMTVDVVESIPRLGLNKLEYVSYPQEAIHEIITNAVLHRDYSIADDVHIRIFDNRIEIQSPGRLPAHITPENILDERFSRNGAVVRILNKFPNPPNKDVGEGLNTAFRAMTKLGLKHPVIFERDNCVMVVVKHEALASPEEAILDYLESHSTISNAVAREVACVESQQKIKRLFEQMILRGLLERVPGTVTSQAAYRKPTQQQSVIPPSPATQEQPSPAPQPNLLQEKQPASLKGQKTLFSDEHFHD